MVKEPAEITPAALQPLLEEFLAACLNVLAFELPRFVGKIATGPGRRHEAGKINHAPVSLDAAESLLRSSDGLQPGL
jgi:hypothetical protein